MSRRVQAAAAVLCVAALLSLTVPVSPRVYWPIAVLVAVVLAALVGGDRGDDGEGGGSSWLPRSGRGGFLCDSCKYDNERDCSRPERPNATRCPDYRRRGS